MDNDEVNAVILSPCVARETIAAYALDEAPSDEITLDKWRHRPMRQRVKEGLFRMIARLL